MPVTNLTAWLSFKFDLKKVPYEAIDELAALTAVAEDRNKIALVDLLRLLVLEGDLAEYVLMRHWKLMQDHLIKFVLDQNLKDKENKVM